jgi:hypothetical protein
MVNYGNTKIYKIWSTQGSKIYIGSTTKEYLSQRMNKHRSDYKCKTLLATSKLLFEEYGVENCFIELIEAKDCKDKHEALQLEGHYIRSLECVNMHIPGRTNKQYKEDNKEKHQRQNKEYAELHKDEIKQKQKVFRELNKAKIKQCRKEFRELNKDKIALKKKEWYEANKEKIIQKQKERNEANKEKRKQYMKQYHESNKEKLKQKQKEQDKTEK